MYSYDCSYIPSNVTIGIFGIGYIGSNILGFLERAKTDVNIVLLNRKNWRKIVAETEFDYFINATGLSGNFRHQPIKTVESNIHLTIDLLNDLKVKHNYLCLSSSIVYGSNSNSDILFEEDSKLVNLVPENIDTLYIGAKILMESIVFNYARHKGFQVTLIRLGSAYGRYENLDDTTLIKKLIMASKRGGDCSVELNLMYEKNYVHIDDAVDGILRATFLSKENNIYNIGSRKSNNLVTIGKTLGLSIQGNSSAKPTYSNLSIKKASNHFDFNPKYDIETGLSLETKKEA